MTCCAAPAAGNALATAAAAAAAAAWCEHRGPWSSPASSSSSSFWWPCKPGRSRLLQDERREQVGGQGASTSPEPCVVASSTAQQGGSGAKARARAGSGTAAGPGQARQARQAPQCRRGWGADTPYGGIEGLWLLQGHFLGEQGSPALSLREVPEGRAQEMSAQEKRSVSVLVLQPCSPWMNRRSPARRNTQG